ncbi:MAG: oxygenase MpaB family protein [Terracidiphilus sp.]
MPSPVTADSATTVSRHDLELCIAAAQARVKNPVAGIFGPDSLTWRINREAALFLGAGRAALLQLAHPWVAVALDQHSSLLAKPVARFHNTFRVVFTMIFGSAPQAFLAARSLYQLHTAITGELPASVAAYAKDSRYQALHIPALLWVYATLIDSAITAYHSVLPPLKDAELAAYYAESKILAGLFGLPPEALPADWLAFQIYIGEMSTSQALGVDDRSRAVAHRIMTGAGSWIPIPRWYQALTAQWLPPRFRQEFALPFDSTEQSRAKKALHNLPRIYAKLPAPLRYVGPWREAQARLAHRAPRFLTQRSNRFWIGQPRMPFAD